jgi:hypothetical protein
MRLNLSHGLVVDDLALCSIKSSTLCVLTELFLAESDLLQYNLVSLAARLDLKETIHGLERNTLGFGNQEPNEYDTSHHHASEEEVYTTTRWSHVEEHKGGESRNDEVEEPVVCGSLCRY